MGTIGAGGREAALASSAGVDRADLEVPGRDVHALGQRAPVFQIAKTVPAGNAVINDEEVTAGSLLFVFGHVGNLACRRRRRVLAIAEAKRDNGYAVWLYQDWPILPAAAAASVDEKQGRALRGHRANELIPSNNVEQTSKAQRLCHRARPGCNEGQEVSSGEPQLY